MKAKLFNEWAVREIGLITTSVIRHSRVVYTLKFLLPALAAGLLALTVSWPLIHGQEGGLINLPATVKDKDDPNMVNPKIYGMDKDNQPYSVTAKTAFQQSARVIAFDQVAGELALSGGSWIAVLAGKGVLDMEKKLLSLSGEVVTYVNGKDGDSFEITTSEVNADLTSKILEGDKPVSVVSNIGSFSGQGFRYDKAQGKIIFKGPVKLRIVKG